MPSERPARRRAIVSSASRCLAVSETTWVSCGSSSSSVAVAAAGPNTSSSQPFSAAARSIHARSGVPVVTATTRSASRTHSPVHSSSGVLEPRSRTRSASRSAWSMAETPLALRLATDPCRASASESPSATSAAGAAESRPMTAILRGGTAAVIGVRLAESSLPIARAKPSARLGVSWISASNASRPSSSSAESRRARTDAERVSSPRSASSPSTSPRRSTRISVSGGPSSTTSRRPLRTMNRLSATSPSCMIHPPAGMRSSTTSPARRSSSSSGRPASTATLRRKPTVGCTSRILTRVQVGRPLLRGQSARHVAFRDRHQLRQPTTQVARVDGQPVARRGDEAGPVEIEAAA